MLVKDVVAGQEFTDSDGDRCIMKTPSDGKKLSVGWYLDRSWQGPDTYWAPDAETMDEAKSRIEMPAEAAALVEAYKKGQEG